MSDDRLTPKEIKAWCYKLLYKYGKYIDEDTVELMYKAYKRGYQDALSG